MKKHLRTSTGLVFLAVGMIACSGASGDGAQNTSTSALSGGEGACGAPVLQVIVKKKEHRFGFDDQQVALNPQIPIQNICQNGVVASCKVRCTQAEAAAVASGVKGFSGDDVPAQLRAMGQLADAFNAALSNRSDFADHPIDQDPGDPDPSTDPNASTTATTTPGSSDAGGGSVAPSECGATILQVIVQGKEHRFGFDDQQVALNPAIPIENICQNRVASSCKAECASAAATAAATGIKGFSGADDAVLLRQMGELADAFNAALGDTTDFTDDPILH